MGVLCNLTAVVLSLYNMHIIFIHITTTADQLRISTGAGGVHDAAIIATCVRAGHGRNACKLYALMQVVMIAASCTPPVPVLILSWSVVVVKSPVLHRHTEH